MPPKTRSSKKRKIIFSSPADDVSDRSESSWVPPWDLPIPIENFCSIPDFGGSVGENLAEDVKIPLVGGVSFDEETKYANFKSHNFVEGDSVKVTRITFVEDEYGRGFEGEIKRSKPVSKVKEDSLSGRSPPKLGAKFVSKNEQWWFASGGDPETGERDVDMGAAGETSGTGAPGSTAAGGRGSIPDSKAGSEDGELPDAEG